MSSSVDGLRPLSRRLRPPSADARRLRQAYREFRRSALPGAAAIVGSALVALIVADALTFSRSRAIVIVYLVVALAAIAHRGLLGVTQLLAATLPWLVVAGTRLPPLTKTFAAAAVTVLVILVVLPRGDGSKRSFFLRLGIVCFYGPVLLSLAREGYSDQFIQAAKYALFPAMVLAVTEVTNHQSLLSLARVALVSGTIAVGANLALGVAGFSSQYYGAGELLGLASEHDLALLAGCVTAACLAASASVRGSAAVAVTAIATVATGVRSTLPGLALLAFAKMLEAGARLRTIALVALAVIAVFVSGAAAVVEARFRAGETTGEFQSFSSLGSGRGEVYSTAIDSWRSSSAIDWGLGMGLRSIPKLQEEKLGTAVVGHSDLVEVGVQLGIVGLIGLFLIWGVLIAGARSKAPLFVLGSFALFNGALEYGAPLVVAILLTANVGDGFHHASSSRPRRDSPVGRGM